jgi:hypothetical protein
MYPTRRTGSFLVTTVPTEASFDGLTVLPRFAVRLPSWVPGCSGGPRDLLGLGRSRPFANGAPGVPPGQARRAPPASRRHATRVARLAGRTWSSQLWPSSLDCSPP